LALFEDQQPTIAQMARSFTSITDEIEKRVRLLYGLTKKEYDAFMVD
jgi:hypothetical protein